jgi:hypothetical protein
VFNLCLRRVEAKKKSFGTLVRHVLYESFTGIGHQSKKCWKIIIFGHIINYPTRVVGMSHECHIPTDIVTCLIIEMSMIRYTYTPIFSWPTSGTVEVGK